MSFLDSGINLNRYQCAQCRRTPEKAQELIQGCICGHRLFRIMRQNDNNVSTSNKKMIQYPAKKTDDLNFLTIHELEVGIYNINVEKLLANKLGLKNENPVVVGNKGIFSIHLQNQKK